MTPEEKQAISYHAQELAKLLYKEAAHSRMTTLGEIEAVVRDQVQQHVTPEIGIFLSKPLQIPAKATSDTSKVSLATSE